MPRRDVIKWTARKTSNLKKAISKYNTAITRMAKSGLYDDIPNYVYLEDELKRITSTNQYYTRLKQLGRILVKNNPSALVPVEVDGYTVPNYLKKEIQYTVRSVNRDRYELLTRIHPNFESYSRPQQAAALADKDLMPLTPDNYSGSMLDALLEEHGGVAGQYVDTYSNMMHEYFSDTTIVSEVEAIITDILAYNPTAIMDIYNDTDDEKEISFVYLSQNSPYHSGTSGQANKAERKVLDYWLDKWNEYVGFGEEHPQRAELTEKYDLNNLWRS